MKKEIPENINNVLQEFVNGVTEILGERLKKIILYGSYTRGDFRDNSDIDIMILTDLSDSEKKDAIRKEIGKLEKKYSTKFRFEKNYISSKGIKLLCKEC